MFGFFKKNNDSPVIEKVVIQTIKPRINDIVEYNFFKKNKVRRYSINMYAKDVPVIEKGDKYTLVAKYNSDPRSVMYVHVAFKKKEKFSKANLFVSAIVENNQVLKNNIVRIFPIF